MFRICLSAGLALAFCGSLLAAEVQVQTKPSPKPSASAASASPAASPGSSPASPAKLPEFRPALLGAGPASVINRIDTAKLISEGQKDGSVMFRCSVGRTGEIMDTWTYRGTAETTMLERELVRCLDTAVFVPAVAHSQTVPVFFFGTVTFQVVNGKPRLRIFANQQADEVKKESDFIGPQPYIGPGSKFEGLHYPADTITSELSGMVELSMKVDAKGVMKDLLIVSEDPPLVGFRRAAAEDFRVAGFIPAFREGKPVDCSITLPVFYEPPNER